MLRIKPHTLFPFFLMLPWIVMALPNDLTVHAVRLTGPVAIDGILSETVWQTAPPATGLLQLNPNEGKPASQKSFIRIAYDDEALYVGADLQDSAPDSIVARLARRDTKVNEDWFAIAIDSYHDHRSGYFFGLTAGGTLFDGVCYNDDWTDDTWDGVWEGRVHRDGNGWTAELRIPFSQLRFKKAERYVWGVDFVRVISRKNEESYLVYTPKNSSGFVSRFPELAGIENISPGRHMEMLPYVQTRAAFTHPDAGDPFHKKSESSQGIGLDMKVALSNNLTLDMTVNPDFGQVEVDPAVVNLSDVETYFSEKRPFFIEGSSIFNFGYGGANSYWGFNWSSPSMFYSRRIGRAPQGSLPDNDYQDTPDGVHILGAAKVTGKVADSWNVGTIHALTKREFGKYSANGKIDEAEVEPLSYYGLFRAQREIHDGRQGIGMLSTVTTRNFDDRRLRQDMNDHALTVGIDGWTFLDTSKTWVIAGWGAGSQVAGSQERILDLQTNSRHYFQRPDNKNFHVDSSATELSGYAGRFYLNKQKGNIIFNSAIGFISPGFDLNDVGFLYRANVLNTHIGGGYQWTQPGKWYRTCTVLGTYFQSGSFDWDTTIRGLWGKISVGFLNYMYAQLSLDVIGERTDLYRTRGGPKTLSPTGWESNFYFETDDRKPWVFSCYWYHFTDGPKDFSREFGFEMEWKPRSNMSFSIEPGISLENEFTQWVDRFDDPTASQTYGKRYVFGEMSQTEISADIRLNWTFTPRLSLQLYVQPLLSHGDYKNFKELDRPNSYAFNTYSKNQIIHADGTYEIDPDGSGPASSFTFDNPDFNVKSLCGNAVLRWEYKPGSTLYLVWTQNRWNDDKDEETYSFHKSADQLLRTQSDNIIMLKATYWWGL